MFCQFCGAPLSPNDKFCMKCGAKVEIQQFEEKIEEIVPEIPEPIEEPAEKTGDSFCQNCGAKLVPGDKFCMNCGAKIEVPSFEVMQEEPVQEEPVQEEPVQEEPVQEEQETTIPEPMPETPIVPEPMAPISEVEVPEEPEQNVSEAANGVFCQSCGAPMSPDDVFCMNCGAKVEIRPLENQYEEAIEQPWIGEPEPVVQAPEMEEPAEETLFCQHCGAKLLPDDMFCMNCGAKVEAQSFATGYTNVAQEQTWNGTQEQTWNDTGWNEVYQEEQPEKKSKTALFIVLGIIAALLVTGIVVFIILWQQGKLPFLQSTESNSKIEEDSRIDEESEPDDKDSSVEESEASEESEESEESALEDSKEESSEIPAEPTSVTLSCGAEVDFDATYVDLSKYQVDDLEGIQQCGQIEVLIVDGGNLTDVTPISQLYEVERIVLNNVPVTDISKLSKLSNLKHLDIYDTKVTADTVKSFQDAAPNVNVVGYKQSKYELIASNSTWEEAKTKCEQAGGHLVTITDEAEMQKISDLLKDTEILYIWLGGYSIDGKWYWVTDEVWDYANWYEGEPSGKDADGTVEDKLCLWNVNKEGWTMNDQRNDLPSISFTKDRLGYILETEQISGFLE